MIEKTNSESATVPVWVDSVKKDPEFPMTRLRYFALEVRAPLPDGGLPDIPSDLQLLVSNLSAIVLGPDRFRERFTSADNFMELFARVRKDGRFSISSPTLWFPNTVFPEEPPVRRGAVYRLPLDLFRAGLLFYSERIFRRQLSASATARPIFSPDETAALAAYSKRQINLSKKSYQLRRNAGNYLHWIGETRK